MIFMMGLKMKIIAICVLGSSVEIIYGMLCFPPGIFNAALNRKTYQSSNYRSIDSSGQAVDGDDTHFIDQTGVGGHDLGTCSHTESQVHTWLSVDLGQIFTIYSVTLTNRIVVPFRLHNFQISASNISHNPNNATDLQLCAYQEENMLAREKKTFFCLHSIEARFVIINKTAQIRKNQPLTLCEVEIEAGCLDGYYGHQCKSKCMEMCEGPCLKNSGFCQDGKCKKGMAGEKCQQCVKGKYGKTCEEVCPSNCAEFECDRETGDCSKGCIPGYNGSRCNNVCPDMTYGDRCSFNCSSKMNCKEPVCDKSIGTCVGKCKLGYHGTLCNISCDPGTYGEDCQNVCHCTSCDRFRGRCSTACEIGFIGDICNDTCSPGFYGPACKHKCEGHCLNNTACHYANGTCINGCVDGYYGNRCDVYIQNNNTTVLILSILLFISLFIMAAYGIFQIVKWCLMHRRINYQQNKITFAEVVEYGKRYNSNLHENIIIVDNDDNYL